ncbi:hypothetical protein QR680_000443 [Steinernema hermaphroditum]|uniref:Uncharacterized protein n=1 Tax=Steinernema hermaphroditum TaxID=289476 RepID=A0AA39GVD3_9BILA|nr:hypothetical protein QR680_000443 [Steinernema hermaphroditum]
MLSNDDEFNAQHDRFYYIQQNYPGRIVRPTGVDSALPTTKPHKQQNYPGRVVRPTGVDCPLSITKVFSSTEPFFHVIPKELLQLETYSATKMFGVQVRDQSVNMSEMNFDLLESNRKATLYLLKVIEKKYAGMWKPGYTNEQKERVFQMVIHTIQRKYREVSAEKIRQVWCKLQHAYLRPDIPCRYRRHLRFMDTSYPIRPLPKCSIREHPHQRQLHQWVINDLRKKGAAISSSTNPNDASDREVPSEEARSERSEMSSHELHLDNGSQMQAASRNQESQPVLRHVAPAPQLAQGQVAVEAEEASRLAQQDSNAEEGMERSLSSPELPSSVANSASPAHSMETEGIEDDESDYVYILGREISPCGFFFD